MTDENTQNKPRANDSKTESSSAKATTNQGEKTEDTKATSDAPETTEKEEKSTSTEEPSTNETETKDKEEDTEAVEKKVEKTEEAKEEVVTKNDYADVQPGTTVRVHQKIKDVNKKGEEKERIQVFEGIVLARKHGNETGSTITVRKIASGIGVEKVFPLNAPTIDSIEVVKTAKVRQSKLGFLRNFKRKKKKLKEKVSA